jgi:hypothetical protein
MGNNQTSSISIHATASPQSRYQTGRNILFVIERFFSNLNFFLPCPGSVSRFPIELASFFRYFSTIARKATLALGNGFGRALND